MNFESIVVSTAHFFNIVKAIAIASLMVSIAQTYIGLRIYNCFKIHRLLNFIYLWIPMFKCCLSIFFAALIFHYNPNNSTLDIPNTILLATFYAGILAIYESISGFIEYIHKCFSLFKYNKNIPLECSLRCKNYIEKERRFE